MKEEILSELREIQSGSDIHILSAREMGSRLMGASHDGSDWDIMFIYAFDEAWKYPAIGHSKKTMDHTAGEMEFHGWNIDKFAKHLQDSNPNAMEFLAAAPYKEAYPRLWRELERDAMENFNHMALYHHYISMAKSNYTKYIESGNDCTKGRQFYIARALACASHIRTAGEFPPMDTMTLVEEGEMNDDLRAILRKLTQAKKKGHGPQENTDIIGPLYRAESEAPMDPTDERTRSPNAEFTNALLRAALK